MSITTEYWMGYCWCRDLPYQQCEILCYEYNVKPPTEKQYKAYCRKWNKKMIADIGVADDYPNPDTDFERPS